MMGGDHITFKRELGLEHRQEGEGTILSNRYVKGVGKQGKGFGLMDLAVKPCRDPANKTIKLNIL